MKKKIKKIVRYLWISYIILDSENGPKTLQKIKKETSRVQKIGKAENKKFSSVLTSLLRIQQKAEKIYKIMNIIFVIIFTGSWLIPVPAAVIVVSGAWIIFVIVMRNLLQAIDYSIRKTKKVRKNSS